MDWRSAALANVDPAGRHVEEMINDTSTDKRVAIAIKVDSPWVARAIGEDLELFGAGMEACYRGVTSIPGAEASGSFTFECVKTPWVSTSNHPVPT